MNEELSKNAATKPQESRDNPEKITGSLKTASDGTEGGVREGLNGPVSLAEHRWEVTRKAKSSTDRRPMATSSSACAGTVRRRPGQKRRRRRQGELL